MKNPRLIVASAIASFALLAVATSGHAGTKVLAKDSATTDVERYHREMEPRPPQIIANPEVKIDLAQGHVFRSCCRPPDYSMMGKVTNVSNHPIDYVRLVMVFKDRNGKIIHTEDAYNSKAVTMGEDAEVAKVLGDKPHFERLAPGGADSFQFLFPLYMAGPFTSSDLVASDIPRDSAVAQAR